MADEFAETEVSTGRGGRAGAWTECHVEAFAFFGGVPARLVPDNLKDRIDKPDRYDPKVNRSYASSRSYGCLPGAACFCFER